MTYAPISLNKLLALVEILESGSVTEAARRLNRTQPSVSKALSDLRAFYDDPLLIRDGNTLTQTPFATTLMRALAEWRLSGEALLAMRSRFEPGVTRRHFVIRASDYHLTAFGPVLRDIALAADQTLSFEFLRPAGTLEQDYQRSGFDFAFQVNAKSIPSYERRLILSEPYVILFDPEHRTAPQDIDAFCAAVFVATSPAGSGPSVIEQHLATLKRSRHVGFRISQVSDAARFVAGSPYLSVVPASAGASAMKSLGLNIAPLFFDVPDVTSYLAWPKSRAADPAIGWLSGQLAAKTGRMAQERR